MSALPFFPLSPFDFDHLTPEEFEGLVIDLPAAVWVVADTLEFMPVRSAAAAVVPRAVTLSAVVPFGVAARAVIT